mmetsp:Transcript_13219/g.25312  ORF Transcript_13219/g.25312 Transcript_13219/m.25312 type:complete len:219 (-) Transcript_13219:54-710(-)
MSSCIIEHSFIPTPKAIVLAMMVRMNPVYGGEIFSASAPWISSEVKFRIFSWQLAAQATHAMKVNKHIAIMAEVARMRLNEQPFSPMCESFLRIRMTMKPTNADIMAKTNIDSTEAPALLHTEQKSSLHSESLYLTSLVPLTPHSLEYSALYSSSPQNVRTTHPVSLKSTLENVQARSDPTVPPNAAPVAITARMINTILTTCLELSLQPLLAMASVS